MMFKSLLLFVTLFTTAYTGGLKPPVCAEYEGLPAWFFNPQGYIGISDMDLDSETALNQAVNRALFLKAASDNMELMSVYELYYHMEHNGDYNSTNKQQSHSMASIRASLNTYAYDIIDYYITKYGEVIVLLNVFDDLSDNEPRNATFSGDYMYYYDGIDDDPDFGDIMTLTMDTPNESLTQLVWQSKTDRSRVMSYSTTENEKTRILEKIHIYDDGGSTTESAVYQNTRHGLWHSLIDTFVQALSNFTPQKTLICSANMNESDIYGEKDDLDYHNKVQDMVRLVYKTHVSCKIEAISISDNNLNADWGITEINKTEFLPTYSEISYSYEAEAYQGVIGSNYSKAKNEARKIASVTSKNEMAKMASYNINSISDDFTISEDDDYLLKYYDKSSISTAMIMYDVEEKVIEKPVLVNGYYKAKVKTRVHKDRIIPLKR